jgi:hypothetical protein
VGGALEMGSSKEHNLIEKMHEQAVRASLRIMHAMRNGRLYRSADGINWNLEEDRAVPPVPEGYTRVTEIRNIKSIKNK